MKKIGKYEVCGLLGRGGMGAVYKVKLPVIGKVLALKLLAPRPELVTLLGHGEIEKRFTAEAITMGRLRHPHIAAVCDYQSSPETFLVMEYYCQNLGARIGETYDLEAPCRRLPLDRALAYTRQTLSGLQRLHRAGIVHRDIKPFNLLLTDEDTVKITDFGLSRLRGETYRGSKNLHVGSPFYTAPEQERDPDQAGPAADLYSVGVMLFRFLTGLLPLEGLDRLPDAPFGLGETGKAFFRKALARRQADRYRNTRQMMSDLDDMETVWRKRLDQVCRLSPTPSVTTAPRPSRRREAVKVVPGVARQVFGLDDLWRPQSYHQPRFRMKDDGTVVDGVANLTWQREGSEFRLNWDEAHRYIERLNQEKWGGYNDWRLPTIDELTTLLGTGASLDEYCPDPVFDQERVDLWSIDYRSAPAAWYVNTTTAYVGRQDKTCYFWVRAVRSSDQRFGVR